MDRIRATMMKKAWTHLNGSDVRQRSDPPRAGRPRDPGGPLHVPETQPLGRPGFAEEALPSMDAVHRFALRLARSGSEAVPGNAHREPRIHDIQPLAVYVPD
jgi:hypothetical protein